MAVTPSSPEQRATGAGTRIAIAAQVAFMTVLAVVLVLLVDWLSERPGMRARIDLTRDDANTLSAQTVEVLERLPVDVTADVFFTGRALERGLEHLGLEAQEHARKVLRLLQEASGGRIEIDEHDLSDRRGGDDPAMARLAELELRQVEPGGVIVLGADRRRQVLKLHGDLCDLDPGYPGDALNPPIAPRIVALRAEEALVGALHKVASAEAPKVLFTKGHGELDPDSAEIGGASELRLMLEADGFQVASWDIEKQGAIPAECQLLVVLGPEQPFTENELVELRRFLDGGGRMVAAPHFLSKFVGPGSLNELLEGYGIRPRMSGVLARPVAQASGEMQTGLVFCAQNVIVWPTGMAAQNPVTESLRRASRRVRLPFARAIDRGTPPPGGAVIQVLTTEPEDWNDLPEAGDSTRHDWNPGMGEERGPFPVAQQAVFPPRGAVPPERATTGGRPEGRIFCLGSSAAFTSQLVPTNRDLLLNAFNWASSREYRVSVGAKSPQVRRIEPGQGNTLARIHLVAVFLLPGLFLALGLFTAWRRRRA